MDANKAVLLLGSLACGLFGLILFIVSIGSLLIDFDLPGINPESRSDSSVVSWTDLNGDLGIFSNLYRTTANDGICPPYDEDLYELVNEEMWILGTLQEDGSVEYVYQVHDLAYGVDYCYQIQLVTNDLKGVFHGEPYIAHPVTSGVMILFLWRVLRWGSALTGAMLLYGAYRFWRKSKQY